MPPTRSLFTLSPNLQTALEYLDRGWSVLSLCHPSHDGCPDGHVKTCTSPGKRPLCDDGHWEPYQRRLPTTAEVHRWFDRVPSANVGFATGPVSGVVGVDVDGRRGLEMLEEVLGFDPPATLMFNTGRDESFRWLYALPEGHPCPPVHFHDADGTVPLSFLGEGLQTVAPPSGHPTGNVYRWCYNHGPGDRGITTAPAELLKVLEAKAGGKAVAPRPAGPGPKTVVAAGGRNDFLFRSGCLVRRSGTGESAMRLFLRNLNQDQCVPPVDDAEVEQVLRSVMRFEPDLVPGDRALATPRPRGRLALNAVREPVRSTWSRSSSEPSRGCGGGGFPSAT
jgi:putative DNA primase/helicase